MMRTVQDKRLWDTFFFSKQKRNIKNKESMHREVHQTQLVDFNVSGIGSKGT